MPLLLNKCQINFRISNGYVDLITYEEFRKGMAEHFEANLIQGPPENKTAIVKCNEGFVLNDRVNNKLFCNQGTWKVYLNNSLNDDNFVGVEGEQSLPECRRIVCKRNPVIVNGRLLKSVSTKSS